MPKRNRSNEQRKVTGHVTHVAPAAEDAQARAARLFDESLRSHATADRIERERKAAVIAHEARHQELIAAKEAAAATIRRLRADGRPREKMAQADAAYRHALAELQEFETGERPHWAPAPMVAVDAVEDDDIGATVPLE
jgi:hypothetical protein